jgi:prepilin-type N-terminal cleavage/methylation domain-containing protein
MILKLRQRIGNNQKGVTMVELLMAMAVSAIIAAAAGTTISQVFQLNARTSNHMIAVRQVQNAGYWVSHDAQMAQGVSTNTSGVFLRLNWVEWNGDQNQVTYSLENASAGLKNLRRNYSVNSTSQSDIIVGQYINPASTSCNYNSDNNTLTLTITATVGSGSRAESETRKYEVHPRPGS